VDALNRVAARRRSLLAGLAALGCPGVARAQAPRRIALILAGSDEDADARARAGALRAGLRQLGWVEGRNLQIDYFWRAGEPAIAEAHARALTARPPDVIVSNGTAALTALHRATRDIPVVFAVVVDPVGAGFVQSLARPGGNITGFATYEPELGAKWLDALREFAPDLRRLAIVTDPAFAGFRGLTRSIEGFAAERSIRPSQLLFRSVADPIEAAIAEFARTPGGGLLAIPTALNLLERDRLIRSVALARLPAIYPFRQFVLSGGLVSYGFEPLDLFRRSAGYVDRILKGERPGDLPVQSPTRFELVINQRTARDLGIVVPPMLLARADEVID